MSETGSLINLHYHNNYEVLEELSDVDDTLYYKDKPISYYDEAEIELLRQQNALLKEEISELSEILDTINKEVV